MEVLGHTREFTNMIVVLPNGQQFDISTVQSIVTTSGSGPTLVFSNAAGSVVCTYECFNNTEMYLFYATILAAIVSGQTTPLVLNSLMALPDVGTFFTAGDSNSSNTYHTDAKAGGQYMFLIIPAGDMGPPQTKGFAFNGVVKFGTNVATLNRWISAAIFMVQVPPSPAAGAVNVTYTDNRGTVTFTEQWTYT